jgi:hypothetical protein
VIRPRHPRPDRGLALLSVVALLIPAASALGAGAWTRDDGGYYVKFGFTSLTADEEYDYGGNRRGLLRDSIFFDDADLGVSSLSLYCEYGILDRITAVVSTQYHVAVRRAVYVPTGVVTTASASGLGDIWVGGRVGLLPSEGPVAASVGVSAKIPTGSPFQDIPLGSGRADYELTGSLGSGFEVEGVTGYGQVSAGYRLRGGAEGEVSWMSELGVNVGSRLIVQGVVDGIGSTFDFASAGGASGDGSSADPVQIPRHIEQSFLRWSFGVIYATSAGFELNLNLQRQEWGRNSLASSAILFGVAWKR